MATITGTEQNDELIGTEDADTLDGLAGDDYLDGGAGADVMAGGQGDDTYVVDDADDTVIEAADEGIDTVFSSVTYSLAPDVEKLYLVGDADINGIGNELGNEIYGNNGNNGLFGNEADDLLDGGAGDDLLDADGGNDTLNGGSGNDILRGGTGDDTYVFGMGYGSDTAIDDGGSDRVLFDESVRPSDVSLQRFDADGDGNEDLVVALNFGEDTLVLSNWFAPESKIESLQFSDGTVVDAAGLELALNNEAPVANADSAEVSEDATGPITGNVLANDSDSTVPAAGLTVTNPNTYEGLYGTLVLETDGSYTYTLNSSLPEVQALGQGQTLTDSFAYGVTDGVALNPLGAGAQLDIVIQGADEAPVCHGHTIIGTKRADHLVGTDCDDVIAGRGGNDKLVGGKGDDLLQGGKGKDQLLGGDGIDILQGGKGKDKLEDKSGSTVFDGGKGKDELVGGRSSDFFAGGRGDDRLVLGGGNDVIAFNKGDGVDRIEGEAQNGVLSLGGGIRYQDLRFRKDGKDLVLETGGDDRLVFEDWYKGKHSVVTLQVVAEAMSGFSQSSADPLRNDKVELFDFRKLVAAFDEASASKKNKDGWKLMNELLDAHLGGSDDAALGGDLAYRYGMTGALAGMSWSAAHDTIAATDFGAQKQALQPLAAAQDDAVKLA